MITKAEVGDVIVSEHFAKGWTKENGHLLVGEIYYGKPEGDFFDSERGKAKFVVEEVDYVFPTEGTADCWKIRARRLTDDGTYDPNGEAIAFYMESDYTTPYIDEVEVVGKMKAKRTLDFTRIE